MHLSSLFAPLLVLTTILDTIQAGPLDNCPLDCGPNGHCFDGECSCDSGFAGADCSFPYEHCPDQIMQCFGTGAKCVKDNNNDDSSRQHAADGDSSRIPQYSCHCDTDVNVDAFEIQQCETPTSQHCEEGTLLSEYAFCTNGGTCRAVVRNGERHAGCHCPPGFEGRHCQYKQGTAPSYELQYGVNSSTGALDAFVKFIISIVCLSLVAGFAYIVYHNYKAKQTAKATAAVTKGLENVEEDVTVLDLDSPTNEEKRRAYVIEAETTMDESTDDMDNVVEMVENNDENMNVDKGEMA
jgi:hypothetical protein